MAIPYSFTSGTAAAAAQVNSNFTYMENRMRTGTGVPSAAVGIAGDIYFQFLE